MCKTTSKQFLEHVASQHHSAVVKGWEKLYEKKQSYLYEVLKRHFVLGSALELGCGDGTITRKMCEDFESVTVVEGSKVFIKEARERVKASNLRFVNTLFEEFTSSERFNTIFMAHILEHLDVPVKLLGRSKRWLATDGKVLIVVPNANSLHRLVGVKLGMLKRKDELDKGDRLVGHKRVYTPQLLWQHVRKAGFRIIYNGGCMLKPLSNRQMESWSSELIEAFFAVGEDMPELCSEIYAICILKN